MSKLVLNIEDLDVKSFDTTGGALEARGTVEAHVDWTSATSLIDRAVSWIMDCVANN